VFIGFSAILDSSDFTSIYDQDIELDELISIILRKMKNRGEEVLNQEVSDVVLGRPASFSEDPDIDAFAEERLRSAARIAGFKNVIFQFEPVAAALAFESNLKEGKEKTVLVGDLGGGTSDFTMIKLRGGSHQQQKERKADILAVGGVYVGGDRFDSDIMWGKIAKYFGRDVKVKDSVGKNWLPVPSLIYKLRHWHLIPQLRDPRMRQTIRDLKFRAEDPGSFERLEILIEENYGLMLFQEIERAKQKLSSSRFTTISFEENEYFSNRAGGPLSLKEDLTREEFEQLIDYDVNKINRCVDEVIRKSGLNAKNIDIVFLTGGSSYIPIIRKGFANRFGPEKLIQQDAFTSVAYGLGLYASLS
jgi:hypothetical chaperone protein